MTPEYILADNKRELIMQVIPVKHELWIAGIVIDDPVDYLKHVKDSIEVMIRKPPWALEILQWL